MALPFAATGPIGPLQIDGVKSSAIVGVGKNRGGDIARHLFAVDWLLLGFGVVGVGSHKTFPFFHALVLADHETSAVDGNATTPMRKREFS